MSNFLHGLGGGLGRGIGRAIAYIVIGFLIYLVVHLLDLDPIGWIQQNAKHLLMFNVEAKQQSSTSFNIYTNYDSPCGSGGAGYCAITTNNTATRRSKGTTYNGVLQAIDFYISYILNPSYQYTINIYAMSTDFRNNNLNVYVYGFNNNNPSGMVPLNYTYSFVSKNQITINLGGYYSYQNIAIYMDGQPLTGISTYGIRKVELVYDDGSTDMSGVIDNQNQNTSDIINNANNNTQDLIQQVQDMIANDEELTNKLIEAQQCPTGPLTLTRDEWGTNRGYVLGSDGSLIAMSGNDISPYLIVKPNTEYQLITTGGAINSNLHYCFYNSNKTFINCSSYASGNTAVNTFITTQYVQYMRISIQGSRTFTLKGPVCNDWEKEAQEKINDTMSDDSIDQSQANSFFNDFQDNDHGLSGIITLPLSTIQALTTSSCIALELPVPFTNEHFSLPCMSQIYQSKAPALYNMWQVVCYGLIGYWIATDIFKLVKGFKDPEDDKVEVLDL